MLVSIIYAYPYEFLYNPYTGKLDRTRSLNQSGYNFTADYFIGDGSQLTGITGASSGDLNWSYLQNYPLACPAYSAITQLDDAVTCTSYELTSKLNTSELVVTGNATINSGNMGEGIWDALYFHNKSYGMILYNDSDGLRFIIGDISEYN